RPAWVALPWEACLARSCGALPAECLSGSQRTRCSCETGGRSRVRIRPEGCAHVPACRRTLRCGYSAPHRSLRTIGRHDSVPRTAPGGACEGVVQDVPVVVLEQ